MKIGVLASQGAFIEHINILSQLGVKALPVRLPHQLDGLDALVIPGGESTSISLLLQDNNLASEIQGLAQNGLPIMGTCAGMIVLANGISASPITSLGLMEISVRRNAFGRQRESFETQLSIPVLGENPFPGVFIRAPVIEDSNSNVEILCRLSDGSGVAARQRKLLASSFHPELTNDRRFHQYFLDIVAGKQ
ncbi:MAG: pyridoxal 5'-phosphate synthase glutaminase subunit PdxT [Dehalococcoidales bacterium]|nr:MAG: pyridoxal 5'-phosphate synthase glutaminase subunit PdxT [Dehalococcoidales bacterium]